MGSCIDLRKYQKPEAISDAYSKVVSGKAGYKAIIERRKVPPRCSKCGRGGDESQKFCPQCGGKMFIPLTSCPSCNNDIEDGEKFCTNCGTKLQ
jgi:predicted amidophosphoribosyltransferase